MNVSKIARPFRTLPPKMDLLAAPPQPTALGGAS